MMTPSNQTGNSLAVVPSAQVTLDSYRKGLEPMTLEKAFLLAETFAVTGMCGIKSPADALARIMTGRELGLTALQSIRGVYMIEGKPSLDASLLMGLCIQHPDCEKFDFMESTNERAVLHVKRRGRPLQEIVWTIDDAKQAKLIKENGAWVKNPKQMLRARCKSDGARLEFPDVTFGLQSREEAVDQMQEATIKAPVDVVGPSPEQIAVHEEATSKFVRGIVAEIMRAETKEEQRAVRDRIKKAKDSGELSDLRIGELSEIYNARFAKVRPVTQVVVETAAAPNASSEKTASET